MLPYPVLLLIKALGAESFLLLLIQSAPRIFINSSAIVLLNSFERLTTTVIALQSQLCSQCLLVLSSKVPTNTIFIL